MVSFFLSGNVTVGPFTLFAPVNKAFENIPPEVLEDLTNVLRGHVVSNLVLSPAIEDDDTMETLLTVGGTTVEIRTNIYHFGAVSN